MIGLTQACASYKKNVFLTHYLILKLEYMKVVLAVLLVESHLGNSWASDSPCRGVVTKPQTISHPHTQKHLPLPLKRGIILCNASKNLLQYCRNHYKQYNVILFCLN